MYKSSVVPHTNLILFIIIGHILLTFQNFPWPTFSLTELLPRYECFCMFLPTQHCMRNFVTSLCILGIRFLRNSLYTGLYVRCLLRHRISEKRSQLCSTASYRLRISGKHGPLCIIGTAIHSIQGDFQSSRSQINLLQKIFKY